MITNISLVTLYVNDQDEAKKFYIDKLGFVETADIQAGPDFRWVTVAHPDHLELEATLMVPGPPLSEEVADVVRRTLADGTMSGFGIATDDCRKTFEELTSKGVDFVQEPQERPYGVEAIIRDNSGNWLVMVERREYNADAAEFPTP